jgi:hypothetical protein
MSFTTAFEPPQRRWLEHIAEISCYAAPIARFAVKRSNCQPVQVDARDRRAVRVISRSSLAQRIARNDVRAGCTATRFSGQRRH